MKKILLLTLFVSFIYSCESQVIKETKDIWENYINTLETAPDNARDVVDTLNKRQESINKIEE